MISFPSAEQTVFMMFAILFFFAGVMIVMIILDEYSKCIRNGCFLFGPRSNSSREDPAHVLESGVRSQEIEMMNHPPSTIDETEM